MWRRDEGGHSGAHWSPAESLSDYQLGEESVAEEVKGGIDFVFFKSLRTKPKIGK